MKLDDPDPVSRLRAIMARLRDPDGGCPWDRAQTPASLVPYTLEEAYEVAEAVAKGDVEGIKGELGDLLFQVVFQARLGEEAGRFDFDDVAAAIGDKLLRRHPHVFGDTEFAHAAEREAAWESAKADERQARAHPGAMDDIPLAMPALARAVKLQRRARRFGFDWTHAAQVLEKIREEIDEVQAEYAQAERIAAERIDVERIDVERTDVERGQTQHERVQVSASALAPTERNAVLARLTDEVGDVLFSVANWARHLGVDPETALRGSNRKFERRFRAMETLAGQRGEAFATLDPEQLEALWIEVKRQERPAP